MDSAEGKELLQQLHKDKELHKQETGDLLADLHKQLVVPPTDIERLTLVPILRVMIVRTAKAYDRDKMLDALGGHATVERHMGRTLYLDDAGQALMPIDDNVFVRGPAPEVKALLTLPTAPEEAKGALDEALELAAGKHQVTAALNPLMFLLWERRGVEVRSQAAVSEPANSAVPRPPASPVEKKEPPPCDDPPAEPLKPHQPDAEADARELLKDMPPEALPFKPLLQARYLALTLDLDEGIRMEGRVAYADKALTADGETSVKTALYVLRELLPRRGRAARGPGVGQEAATVAPPAARGAEGRHGPRRGNDGDRVRPGQDRSGGRRGTGVAAARER